VADASLTNDTKPYEKFPSSPSPPIRNSWKGHPTNFRCVGTCSYALGESASAFGNRTNPRVKVELRVAQGQIGVELKVPNHV